MINLKNQGEKEAFVTGLLMNGGAISGDSGGTGPQASVNIETYKQPTIVVDFPDAVTAEIKNYSHMQLNMYKIRIISQTKTRTLKDILLDGVSMLSLGILCKEFIIDRNVNPISIINIVTEPLQKLYAELYDGSIVPLFINVYGFGESALSKRNLTVHGALETEYKFEFDRQARYVYITNISNRQLDITLTYQVQRLTSYQSLQSISMIGIMYNGVTCWDGVPNYPEYYGTKFPGKIYTFTANFTLAIGDSQFILD